jgi:plasmid stability protein
MGDLLIRNLEQWVVDAVKAEAARHGRSLSDQAQVIIIRRLTQDGNLERSEGIELLREFNATLAEGT